MTTGLFPHKPISQRPPTNWVVNFKIIIIEFETQKQKIAFTSSNLKLPDSISSFRTYGNPSIMAKERCKEFVKNIWKWAVHLQSIGQPQKHSKFPASIWTRNSVEVITHTERLSILAPVRIVIKYAKTHQITQTDSPSAHIGQGLETKFKIQRNKNAKRNTLNQKINNLNKSVGKLN